MNKFVLASIAIACVFAACGSYTTPPEEFLAAHIQFAEQDLTKKNVSVANFVEYVKSLRSGDRDTSIQGWVQSDTSWTLVSESAGEKYEYKFTDTLTDRSGKAIVVFQSIYRDGKIQDTTTLLNLIIR